MSKTLELMRILDDSPTARELPIVRIHANRLLISLYGVIFAGMFLVYFGAYENPAKDSPLGHGIFGMLISLVCLLVVPLLLRANISIGKEGFKYGLKYYRWSDVAEPFEVKWVYSGNGNAVVFQVNSKQEKQRPSKGNRIAISNLFYSIPPKLLADVMNLYRNKALSQ